MKDVTFLPLNLSKKRRQQETIQHESHMEYAHMYILGASDIQGNNRKRMGFSHEWCEAVSHVSEESSPEASGFCSVLLTKCLQILLHKLFNSFP